MLIAIEERKKNTHSSISHLCSVPFENKITPNMHKYKWHLAVFIIHAHTYVEKLNAFESMCHIPILHIRNEFTKRVLCTLLDMLVSVFDEPDFMWSEAYVHVHHAETLNQTRARARDSVTSAEVKQNGYVVLPSILSTVSNACNDFVPVCV